MSEAVARYYDRNTSRFLLVGRGRGAFTIHRELWGPGVGSARDAASYIDRLVADRIEELVEGEPASLIDFGCGVGGTLLLLGDRFPGARLHGVTISGKQAHVAERLAARGGVSDRCAYTLGDFHTVDLGETADALVAIESLSHGSDFRAVLSNAAKHLRPGGLLLVADDFLVAEAESLGAPQRRRVDQLRAGWQLPGLGTVERLTGEAERQGLKLKEDLDLTGYTRPGSRIRDRLVAIASPLLDGMGLARVPFCGNVIGGNALQVGLREGFIRYRLLVYERSGAVD